MIDSEEHALTYYTLIKDNVLFLNVIYLIETLILVNKKCFGMFLV